MMRPGEMTRQIRKEMNRKFRTNYVEGVRGLKDLGSRELTYKLMFYGQMCKKVDQDERTFGNQNDEKDQVRTGIFIPLSSIFIILAKILI